MGSFRFLSLHELVVDDVAVIGEHVGMLKLLRHHDIKPI
jgi:hypothetical protein